MEQYGLQLIQPIDLKIVVLRIQKMELNSIYLFNNSLVPLIETYQIINGHSITPQEIDVLQDLLAVSVSERNPVASRNI